MSELRSFPRHYSGGAVPRVLPCSSCSASIRWAVSPAGNRFPLDAEPDPVGYWCLDGDRARKWTPMFDAGSLRYRAHWATCPDADAWRDAAS